MKISNHYTISFKAGLTPAVQARFAMYSAPGISQGFRNVGIDANFEYNRPIACCCAAVNDIFDTLCRNYNLPLGAKPPSIRLFNQDNLLLENAKNANGFCIPDSGPVLKNEPYIFEARSVFYNDCYKTLHDLDKYADLAYSSKFNSTNHFLHTYMHEWVHNIHNDIIYRTFGYDGACPRVRARYNTLNGLPYDPNPFINGLLHSTTKMFNKSYTPEERKTIFNEVSTYAAGTISHDGKKIGGNPFEVVAEYVTKSILDSLDEDTLLPTRNPFAKNNTNASDEMINIFSQAWSGII